MRADEAATMLGISRSMVTKAIRQGNLPATRIGRWAWSIAPEAIDHYRAHHRAGRTTTCARCGDDFATRSAGNTRYCSRACGDRADLAMRSGHTPDTPKDGHWYVAYAICQHCGTEYQHKSRAKFCSTTCRVHAFYARHGINPSAYTYGRQRVKEAS